MDEALLLFSIFCAFLLLLALIWCFLSTCLGVPLRRADLLAAFTLPTPSSVRAADTRRQRRAEERRRLGLADEDDDGAAEGYEMGSMMARGGAGVGGVEDWDMIRRGGSRGLHF